jgi:hypothetical protein
MNCESSHSFLEEDAMKHQRPLGLLAVVALFLVLGCQIANLLGSTPTPVPPAQPPVVLNTPVPPIAPPPELTPVLPIPVVASPTPEQVAPPPTSPTQLPPPPASMPPGCMNPNQVITSPTNESTVSGLIEIRGTATRPDMQYWKVEYRADTSTAYVMLGNSEKAVTDSVLARLSTKTLPNGVYWIRLVIVQKDGNFGTPCELRLIFSN